MSVCAGHTYAITGANAVATIQLPSNGRRRGTKHSISLGTLLHLQCVCRGYCLFNKRLTTVHERQKKPRKEERFTSENGKKKKKTTI